MKRAASYILKYRLKNMTIAPSTPSFIPLAIYLFILKLLKWNVYISLCSHRLNVSLSKDSIDNK